MEWLQTYKIGDALLKSGSKIEDAYYQSYRPSINKEGKEKTPFIINIQVDTEKEIILVEKKAFDIDNSINVENLLNAGGSSYTGFYIADTYAKFKKGFLEFFGLAKNKEGKDKNQDILSEIIKLKKDRKIDLSQSSFLELRKRVVNKRLLCDKFSALVNNIEFVIEGNKLKKLENMPQINIFSASEVSAFKNFVKIDKEGDEIAGVTLTIDSVPINRDENYKKFCLERLYKLAINYSKEINISGYFDHKESSFAASFPRDGKVNLLKCSTNSPTALPNLNGTAFLMSEESYNALKIGAKKIDTDLKISIARVPHYVIPEFTGKFEIKRLRSEIAERMELALNPKELGNTQKSLYKISNDEINSILLLGHQKGKGDIDFVNSIRIPSANYFDQLMDLFEQSKAFSNKILKFSFQQIYYLFPVPSDKSKKPDSLFFYKSVFENTPYDHNNLTSAFANLIRIYRYGRPYEKAGKKYYGGTINITYAEKPEFDVKISDATRKFQSLLNLLNLLQKENNKHKMDYSILPPKTQVLFEQCRYNEDKAALFYLGKLLRLVADAQSKKQKNKRRPVLDKINYGGMKLTDLKWLFSEIFEKMKQYEVLRYANEDITEFKRFFDLAEAKDWKLTEIENVFYLFSGYAMYWEVMEDKIKNSIKKLKLEEAENVSDETSTGEDEDENEQENEEN